MKTHRPMFVSMLMILSVIIHAQDNATPAPAAADAPAPAAVPAQTEMQKWIATTDAQWQAVFKRDVSDAHVTELEKLKQQYVASLEAAVTKASGAGDLDGVVALRNEQKRFAGTNVFPEQDEAADAATVKQIRAAVRAQIARLDKDTATRTKALHAKYDQVLAQAQTQLTQHQRIEDALMVKAKREEVTAAWLAGIAASPAPAPVEPSKPKPRVPASGAPAVAAAPEPATVGGNLFKNPNFANGTDGWTISDKTGAVTIDPQEQHDGKPSLRIINGGATRTMVLQKVAVKPGARYQLSAYIKTLKVIPEKKGAKEGAELFVNGALGGSRRSVPISATTGGWHRVTYTVVTTASETEISVGLALGHYYGSVTGTAWFSELSLTELGQNAKK